MGLLKTAKEGLNSLLGGAKVTLDETSSGLKSSVESFIGDIVIRSTFNRAKTGILSILSEDSPSPARLAKKSEPTADALPTVPAVTSSNDLMARLMGNFSEPLAQAAKKMAVQFDDTLTNVGDEITRGLKRTIKSKVESIQADDVVNGLSQFLNGSLQKLSGEEGVQDKKEGENSTFNLNGTIQMFGWVLMSVGTLLLAGGLNQGILNPTPVQPAPVQPEPVQEEAPRFSC